jgi:hypothetical protein
MADQAGSTRELTLRYPVFAIVVDHGEEHDGLVVVDVSGQECLPLFLSREVAELYVEQAGEAGQVSPLQLRAHRGDDELDHLLNQLPDSVGHVVWDITLHPQGVRMTDLRVLRKALKKGA